MSLFVCVWLFGEERVSANYVFWYSKVAKTKFITVALTIMEFLF